MSVGKALVDILEAREKINSARDKTDIGNQSHWERHLDICIKQFDTALALEMQCAVRHVKNHN